MWLLCIAVWLLSGAVKGVWDSFGVIPCDSNAMGWSVKTTSSVLLKAVRNKRVPRLSVVISGESLGLVQFGYAFSKPSIYLYIHADFLRRKFKKGVPIRTQKATFR